LEYWFQVKSMPSFRRGGPAAFSFASVLPSLFCLCWFSGVVPRLWAGDNRALRDKVQLANVSPRRIRLPIIDAADNRFVRISTAQGLSEIKADHIAQDEDGFIWFGTRYGLYRYDGYAFKVFAQDPENPNSFDGVAVSALFRDHDGALWVGSSQSLSKFDRTTETFKRYPIPFANHISQDAAGMLWLTCRGGLYSLDPASGRIQHYSYDPNDPSSLSSNDPTYCGEDRRGAFWVVSSGHLEEFDRRTGKVTRRILLPEVPYGTSFYEDSFGMFWIYHGSPNSLAVFDRETNTLTHYAFPDREPPVTDISAMLEDRNGALWIATHGLGLLKLDREHGRFVQYTNVPTDPESLPQNKVDDLFMDRVGNIWAAPGRMAPTLFPTKPPPFKRLPKVPGSTIEPFVGALYEDRRGILWIGAPEALIRLDRKTGSITAYKTGGPEAGTDVVSISEDRSGNLWVGTWSHGLHRFDRRTGKFKTYRHNPADPYSLSNDIVMRLFVDHNGTMWAATGDGVNRFDPLTERFITYRPDPQRPVLCLTLAEDQEGKIWIGTESAGLSRFDPVTGQFVTYQHNRNLPGTLSDNRVNSVYFDRSGAMWVGTQNGLDKLDPRTGKFTAFTQREGLPGNAVSCVLEGNNGNLWMSTNNGVARFNSEQRTFSNFSTTDGLPGPNLTGWGACFQSPSGEMFFGGFNGGASFFPDKVINSSYAPPIVLTDFRLSGNRVEIGGSSPLRRSISHTTDLTLPHQQNVFSITFAALNYASPVTNRYRYRLEGLESDWNEVGSDRRHATYTTLPAGTYTFRAQGATRTGPWSEPGVSLRIDILPPFWGTWWFRTASAILMLVSLWYAYRLRLRQIAWQFNLRLEERVNERTRIARELHDTLLQSFHGLMLQFRAVYNFLPSRPAEARETLESALAQARQAITEGRDAVQGLRESAIEANDLAQALQTLSEELNCGEINQLSRIDVQGTPRDLHPIIRDEVYRIAGEALRNAFRHAQAPRIEVEVRYDERQFGLRVRDDGKGIDPKVLREGRTGHFGLPGMQERARRIGGNLDVWSELESGTEVEVTVPGPIAYTVSRACHRFRLFGRKPIMKP
jgi:ligand-binding sensor domain-containing protein/signal transduction histidine kinase